MVTLDNVKLSTFWRDLILMIHKSQHILRTYKTVHLRPCYQLYWTWLAKHQNFCFVKNVTVLAFCFILNWDRNIWNFIWNRNPPSLFPSHHKQSFRKHGNKICIKIFTCLSLQLYGIGHSTLSPHLLSWICLFLGPACLGSIYPAHKIGKALLQEKKSGDDSFLTWMEL